MSDEAGGFQDAVPPAYYQPPAYYPPQPPPGYYPPQGPGYPQQGYPPPGYAPPGYQPPGYAQPGYPPPGYPQPGYPPQQYAAPGYPPPGYAQPGYAQPGYAPPGYPQPGYAPPALKPGVIPLRPLTLSDIYNGAVAYIRMNPKATMGLTAVVVVVAQVIALILQVGPLAASGALNPAFGATGELPSTTALVGSSLSGIAGALTTWLSSILLTGLLTVIVGRAVFGASITIGEAWQRVRGRLLALFAVTALEAVGVIIVVAIGVGVVFGVSQIASGGVAFLVGVPVAVVLGALLVYLWTMLSFAPPLIVLERLGVMAAITRSFALIRNDFWRVLGIRLLALLVAGMIAGAVTFPFSTAGQITLMNAQSHTAMIVALVLISVGGAIGEIITAPFTAGVVVLQYADRRMRAEAFDLVLLGGVAAQSDAPADSTDHLWLTPHP